MKSLFGTKPRSDALANAIRRFESGLLHQAGNQLLEILAAEPDNAGARYYFRLVERRLKPPPTAKPTLMWQFKPDGAWETDWLRLLLKDSIVGEVVDNTWTKIVDPMIVVDNRLVPEKVSYYREAFEAGCRVILLHLSDEAFKDDLGAYPYCDAVIRNYRSDVLADFSRLMCVPLGYKAGFAGAGAATKPAADRRHLWSFAGDANKLTRKPMIEAMSRAAPGHTHLTQGFNAADNLSTADYRALLDDTVIVPCPSGWSNLETFRLYEALEAGCIPIVERRPGFDYYTDLLGQHPIPTVDDWAKAAQLVQGWQKAGALEHVRQTCAAWWRDYVPRLAGDVGSFVKRAFNRA